jgi:hypothetical protein
MTLDSMYASKHEGVPRDFVKAMAPALALKPDCIFSSRQARPLVSSVNSTRSAGFACALRLSDLIHESAVEMPVTSEPQSSDTLQLLCNLLLRCSRRCRPHQKLWSTPDTATRSRNLHCDIATSSSLWTLGCRAAAGAIITKIRLQRSNSDAQYPHLQQTNLCNWNCSDLRAVSSYEAANPAPVLFGNADVGGTIASLQLYCGHCISNAQPQSAITCNEGLLLLQIMCCSCQPEPIMCAGTLQHLLQFTLNLLDGCMDAPVGFVRRRPLHLQAMHDEENEDKGCQIETYESGIGICCNAIEVIHVRFSSLACRVCASRERQLLNLSFTSRLLDDVMSSPVKADASLVSFAKEMSLVLTSAQEDSSVQSFFCECGHALALMAASAAASRGNFARSCLIAVFFRMYLNAADESVNLLQGSFGFYLAYFLLKLTPV